MKNNLVFTVGATTLITLCALALALTFDNEEDISTGDSDYMVRNIYQEIVWEATDMVKYYNVINAVNEKVEKDTQRELEHQRQQEELERKDAEEAKKSNILYEDTFNITFYTAGAESTGKSKADKWYGITASGTKVKEGRTVACPKNIKFGTKVYIEGFGERICEDRGGAINTPYKLDVYVDSYNEAIKLGRQYLHVKVYKGE